MFEKYDAYKDSGNHLISQIPSEWSIKRLKFFSTLKARIGFHGLTSNDFIHEGAYCITGTDFVNGRIDFSKCYYVSDYWYNLDQNIQVKNGDILVTKDGTIGKIAIMENLSNKATLNSGVFLLRPNIHERYLYWSLNSCIFTDQVEYISRGSTINHLYERDFKNFSFIIPPNDDQIKISSFLDCEVSKLSNAIKMKEQQIALLNERKQIVIQKAVIQGLDPNVPMKDSGVEWIGDIPEHWEIIKVKNLFKLIIEPAPKNNDLELLSVYTDIGVKPRKELEERGNKASTTDGYWKVKKGDIIVNKLLAWMGAIGLSNYDGVTSPAYDILRATKPLNPYIYHLLFRSPTCSAELKKHSRGIMDMRLRLYFDKFGDVLVPYAPIAEQNEIIKYIEVEEQKINAGIELINQQIEKLKEYKTTLINDAVTGKIKVA